MVTAEVTMKKLNLSPPELAFIAATRALLGAGIGLLLADKLPKGKRHGVGLTLLTVGVLTTVPVAYALFGEDLAARWKKISAA
jgi:hypothetical protein